MTDWIFQGKRDRTDTGDRVWLQIVGSDHHGHLLRGNDYDPDGRGPRVARCCLGLRPVADRHPV